MNHFSFEKKKKLTILILGSGGREYSLAKVLSSDNRVKAIVVSPGNGGTQIIPKVFNKPKEERYEIYDLVIPGSETYLDKGLVDLLTVKRIPCFGPLKHCAKLETSKIFAKQFMKRYNLPTAAFQVVSSKEEALKIWKDFPVIKADGLMGGKGVFLPETEKEAIKSIDYLFQSQSKLVMEKKCQGPEYSLLCFFDGRTLMPLPIMKDYKRLYDRNLGPNTGGMGCTGPYDIEVKCLDQLQKALAREFSDYVGCFYIGLMGDNILEFNVRFGDPEIQSLTYLLNDNFPWLDYILGTVDKTLCQMPHLNRFVPKHRYVSTVILCHPNYPGNTTRMEAKELYNLDGTVCGLDHTGFTTGGRLYGVHQIGDSIEKASEKVYNLLKDVKVFHYRKDLI